MKQVEQRMFFEALCTTLYFEPGSRTQLTPWRLAFLEEWASSRELPSPDPEEDNGFPFSRLAVTEMMNEVATVVLEMRGGQLTIVDEVLRDEMILESQVEELTECLRTTGAPSFADKIAAGWRPMAAEEDTLAERVQALEFAAMCTQELVRSHADQLRELRAGRELVACVPTPSEAIGSVTVSPDHWQEDW